MQDREPYEPPTVELLGTLHELTRGGSFAEGDMINALSAPES